MNDGPGRKSALCFIYYLLFFIWSPCTLFLPGGSLLSWKQNFLLKLLDIKRTKLPSKIEPDHGDDLDNHHILTISIKYGTVFLAASCARCRIPYNDVIFLWNNKQLLFCYIILSIWLQRRKYKNREMAVALGKRKA